MPDPILGGDTWDRDVLADGVTPLRASPETGTKNSAIANSLKDRSERAWVSIVGSVLIYRNVTKDVSGRLSPPIGADGG